MNFLKFLKTVAMDCITGIDGVSIDPARVYLAAAVIVYLGAESYVVFKTGAFDSQSFGIGFGALVGGGCFGIAAKSKTEPGEKP